MFVHTPKGALATPTVNLVTSVGRSWMMWDMERMTLVFVGPESGGEIKSLVQTGTEVFAAVGSRVLKYHRGKQTGVFKAPAEVNLASIQILGDQLLALREDGTGLYIFDLASGSVANELQFHPAFQATVFLHPSTYLNKILIGGKTGELQLWNVRTCSLIHTFAPASPSSHSPVTALVQAPAVDVVGVGHLDGSIRILDIRQGDLVMQLKVDDGSVTGLAFRMDGPPILASSSSAGSIAFWDLSKGGRVIHVQRRAHERGISGLEWVPGQPLLISSSGDNSIKQWLFDSPTSVPRLLKFRGGHHAPPSWIRYHGEDGKDILTAGRDRSLRNTSVVRDSRSHELSQGQSLIKKSRGLGISADELKLPPITAMSSSSTRSKDWDDILTAHAEETSARTWRAMDKKMGTGNFEMEHGVIQAVCVTACGNFGLAGSSAGEIKMWNMQSGKERRSFGLTGEPRGDTRPGIIASAKGKAKEKARAPVRSIQAVTGIATDALNTTVIASTLEGKLYFFDFHSTKLGAELQLPSSITALGVHRDSGILSAICDDLVVRLVDIETRRVVRELRGFKGRILDLAFSPDSRWLITTSIDSIVRTYDIPTGSLVDAFRTESIATSLTFSPTGDFLATAHVDSLGVHLWANKAQFSDVAFSHINDEDDVQAVALPSVQVVDDLSRLEGFEPIGAPEPTDIYTSPEQLTEGLLTLSLMPRSRWQTLLNLDTIRARNKPKEPPKAPEKAPFFLPTVAGLETRFDLSSAQPDEASSSTQKISTFGSFIDSDFTRRLMLEPEDSNYSAFFEFAKALSPSALDLEIRSLSSIEHLSRFLHALTARLKSHRDFEAVQALLSVLLTVSADLLIANEELCDQLVTLREEQGKESARLRELVGYTMGTLSFLRGA
ncbi:putative WD-repeat protein [Kockovaella imperatae]|uniref:Putative WD-repeat protein n=1 Tax=Kockovaella imperatae TaxID=4999 RepID=A0A1Y1UPT8_9TREE|nr:putative WD-repeat protein [Kockovaella imperatae]ORX40070.1 putative WD-repeat protein [Kockovaella imperatae]